MLRLDINLVFTIINLIVLFVLMRIFLFKPVNNIIAKREEAIRKQFDDADATRKEAENLKTEYEASLAGAKDESARLITEAKEKARGEYDRIVKIQKAQETIEEEKQKTMRNMQSEIQGLVVAAATKVVGSQVQAGDSSRLYDDFIAEMGETK